jgi:hypothetical protein
MPCTLETAQRFAGQYGHHLPGRRVRHARKQKKLTESSASTLKMETSKELQFGMSYPSSLRVSRQRFCMHFSYLSCLLRTGTSLESFLRSKQSLNYSRIYKHFTDSEVSLPCSQEPITGPIPSQINLVHNIPRYFSKIHNYIIHLPMPRSP